MRILIHSINFSPELTGIGKYSGEMAEWLAAQGHEVRVVTAPPYYPQWKVAAGYENRWNRGEVRGLRPQGPSLGILGDKSPVPERRTEEKWLRAEQGGSLVIFRCPLWVPSKPSGLKRVLHLASFALSSFPIMLWQIFWRPEVVFVVEPPLFCAPQAWLVARLSGGKAWLHIQDYEVDAAFDLGLLKGVALRGLVAAGERWLMRRFDRVSTISQRMLDRAMAKGVSPERAVLFPNWVEIKGQNKTGLRTEDSGLSGYRAELGIAADAVVALYSGNMGGKQGLEILAQVAKLLAQDAMYNVQENAELEPCALSFTPEVIFVFCGNGAGRGELVTLCEGLSNVRFLDLQPAERLYELLAIADIHLLPQRADAADLMMPSKLTGMLASGRSVLATAHKGTELATVVENCGLVVPPGQPLAFLSGIKMLAKNAALRARLGAAGRAYAEANLDVDAVLGRFDAELAKLRAER